MVMRGELREEAWELGLRTAIESTSFAELGDRRQGKVRDSYVTSDGRRYIVVTDRVSAFDRVMGTLPFKGQVLNQIAAWWFEQSAHVAPNHMLALPDANIMEVRECKPLPVEMVMRAYLTGVTSTSIWTHYQSGARTFCGHRLPDGLRWNEKLPAPILTPSTKAGDGAHDVSMSRAELIASGVISATDFDEAASLAESLFDFGQKRCAERGLILVDTKYEFGRDANGQMVVIDEVHTPDSSRFWYESTYEACLTSGRPPESFDKEYLRRWLAGVGFKGEGEIPRIPVEVRVEAAKRYLEAFAVITGAELKPDLEDPERRMRKHLGLV